MCNARPDHRLTNFFTKNGFVIFWSASVLGFLQTSKWISLTPSPTGNSKFQVVHSSRAPETSFWVTHPLGVCNLYIIFSSRFDLSVRRLKGKNYIVFVSSCSSWGFCFCYPQLTQPVNTMMSCQCVRTLALVLVCHKPTSQQSLQLTWLPL